MKKSGNNHNYTRNFVNLHFIFLMKNIYFKSYLKLMKKLNKLMKILNNFKKKK